MKNQLLALALAFGGTLFAMSSQVQAQIPLMRGGKPVFRAAYFSPNGPQPFSTRRMREVQAARSQGVSRGTFFSRSPSRYQRSGRLVQSLRRPAFFRGRGSRFR